MLILQTLQTARQGKGDFEVIVINIVAISSLCIIQGSFHLLDRRNDTFGLLRHIILFSSY